MHADRVATAIGFQTNVGILLQGLVGDKESCLGLVLVKNVQNLQSPFCGAIVEGQVSQLRLNKDIVWGYSQRWSAHQILIRIHQGR